ncbi:MAG TPA: hypothetical protein VIW22_06510 [Nitrososphaerales archaeon]
MAPSLPGDGINFTEQAPAESAHAFPELKDPPVELKDTFPVGVIEVPTPVESETVAVQIVGTLTGTVDGEQESVVELCRRSTVITIDAELGP